MAGLYVVWTKGLAKKSEVVRIATATGLDRRQVAGTLMELWEWAEDQTEDGHIPGVSVRNLSALIADTNGALWSAMQSVGWLRETDAGIFLPNFERWMGRSAKRRLRENQRKSEERSAKRPQSVRKMSALNADKNGTTEQNRTEHKKNPPFIPPSVEEVANYCRDRGNAVDAEAFVAHYAARGWRTGSGAIRNWRACVITWEKNEARFAPRGGAGVDLFKGIREFAEAGK